MRTGICLFLDWENEIWVTGIGSKSHKDGNGKHVCYYKNSNSWTRYGRNKTKELHSMQHTFTKITSIYTDYSAKLVSKRADGTQNCFVKLDVTMKNLHWNFFSISTLGL